MLQPESYWDGEGFRPLPVPMRRFMLRAAIICQGVVGLVKK
jgi:hypothetical protein